MLKNIKNKLVKKALNFSMIEIVMALIVIVIGIIGVIGLFPVGIDTQKAAVAESYAGDAAEQFLQFNASKIAVDWNWVYCFADSKAMGSENWGDSPAEVFTTGNVTIYANSSFDPAALSASNVYNGMFRLEQETIDGQVDFAAVLRCWKTLSSDGSSAALSVEISFPEGKPYAQREKGVFYLEVFKPEESTIDTAVLADCTITRYNDSKCYSITLESVVDNGDDTYDVELSVSNDGSAGVDCGALDEFEIAGDTTGVTGTSFDGCVPDECGAGSGSGSGSGAPSACVSGTVSGIDVVTMSNIGGGVCNKFGLNYTVALSDGGSGSGSGSGSGAAPSRTSLAQKFEFNLSVGSGFSIDFTNEDFITVLNCTN